MNPEVVELSSWMEKKGSKFGFWHKRFCVLKLEEMELRVYKSNDLKDLERTIKIDQNTKCDIVENEKPPRFIVRPQNEKQIILANDSKASINTWVSSIRTLAMTTPGLSMDSFNVISVIGRGFYGKVTLCENKKTKEVFAIKSVHKNRLMKAHRVSTVVNERNVLMNIHHPFIVHLYFAFQTASKVYMGMEYVPGGDLFYHLSRKGTFTEEQVRMYAAEISLALDYLHKSSLVFRDLKPENVLLDSDGHIKLTDFGLVKNIKYKETTSTFCGTPLYLAPEVIEKKAYGPMVDWWSLGVMIYRFTFGKCPWEDENINILLDKIVKQPLKFPEGADEDTKDLIEHLLQKDPAMRCGMEYVIKHPFFKGLDFVKVLSKTIKPTYIPEINSENKPNLFDTCFLKEEVTESLATPIRPDSDAFEGFSFMAPLDKSNDSLNSVKLSEADMEKYTPSSDKFDELFSS